MGGPACRCKAVCQTPTSQFQLPISAFGAKLGAGGDRGLKTVCQTRQFRSQFRETGSVETGTQISPNFEGRNWDAPSFDSAPSFASRARDGARRVQACHRSLSRPLSLLLSGTREPPSRARTRPTRPATYQSHLSRGRALLRRVEEAASVLAAQLVSTSACVLRSTHRWTPRRGWKRDSKFLASWP